jgi:Ca2+-binding EF-hand superfamily protein
MNISRTAASINSSSRREEFRALDGFMLTNRLVRGEITMNTRKFALSGLIAMAFGAALVLPALAQRPEKPQRPGRTGEARAKRSPEERFKRLDKNGDGKWTQDEVPTQAWERLSRFDANKDGAITKEELQKGRPGGPGARTDKPRGRRTPGEMMARLDTNKDGKLSQAEVPANVWERISRLDKNKDGEISKEEFASLKARKGDASGRPARPTRPARPGKPDQPANP